MSNSEIDDITGRWDPRDLPPNVCVGEGVWLERKDSFGRFRSLHPRGLVLGNRVRVYTWATFNVEPEGRIEIGDDSVLVGPVFMCAEHIRVGRRAVISYHVTIADSDFHPLEPEDRRRDAVANAPSGDRAARPVIESRPVAIDDDVWIGIGAMVLKGVHIGRGAHVGAGAVVTADVPPGARVEGNPARVVGKAAP